MTMPRPTSWRSGTVMIEMIAVTALVGVTTITLYLALIYGQTITVRANHYARASQIATQEMENVRATAYASLATPYNGAFIGNTDAVSELPSGTSNLTTSFYDAPANTIKQAVVTVTWSEHGRTDSVQYTTLVVSNGLYQ